jgi:cyclase
VTSRAPFFLGILLATCALAQQNGPGQIGEPPNPPKNDVEIVPVHGNIYLLSGAGANMTLSVGPDGVLVVDSGRAGMSEKALAAIQHLNHDLSVAGKPIVSSKPVKPIRYIVNTSPLAEHVGGNEKLAESGKTFTGGNVTAEFADATEGASILAHENALQQLSDAKMASKGLPMETYFGGVMKLSHFFNGEGVELIHIPAAVTDADSIVYFRGSDVISAGDIFNMTSYPYIDLQHGGSVQGILAGLNRMLDLVVPEFRSEGGTLVIPGHGRICDTADLAYYRDMVTIIRDRIRDMMKRDLTLEQVKAAKPTEDWDPRFGTNPAWTPDMFVEAVYKSLGKSSVQTK